MLRIRQALLALLVLGLLPGRAVHGASVMDRATALAVARSVDTKSWRHEVLDATVAGSTADVLERLDFTAHRTDWSDQAVDGAIHDYAQALRGLPRGAVPAEIMTWLKAYEPRAWVAHEEYAAARVPLFNVRGVAAGVENDWLRQDALLEGLALIASNPRSLVDAWLIETHPASRLGYLQAVAQARPDRLSEVSRNARYRLDRHPELTALAGRAALQAGDVPALGEVFVHGSGPDLALLMRDAALALPPEASAALLDNTLAASSGLNAALAIAELAPVSSAFPSTQALLLARLDDSGLGPTAALALSRVASPASLKELKRLAGDQKAKSARLARYALELRDESERQGLLQ